MLTQHGMQTYSEGEPGTNKKANQDKEKKKRQLDQTTASTGKNICHLSAKEICNSSVWSQGQSSWHQVGLERLSHKGLTTTLACGKTQHCANLVKACDRGWL